MLRGLIGGLMTGVGGAYANVAKGELDNQQKLDYQERYLQMLEEKEKRVAEFTQDLEVAGIVKKATATAAAAPILARGKANAAPIEAEGDAAAAPIRAAGDAAAAPIKAGADASSTIIKANMPGYTDAISSIEKAKSAGDLEEIKERNKYGGGGFGGGKGDSSIDLERRFKAANRNLAQELGVADNKVNEELASLKRRAERGDERAKKKWDGLQGALTDWQNANTALRNFTRNSKGDNISSNSGGSGNRPDLSSFDR